MAQLSAEGVALPERTALARIGPNPPKVGKYSVDVGGFEAFALPTLTAFAKKPAPPLPPDPRLYTDSDGKVQAVGFVREQEEGGTCLVFEAETGKELEVNASQLEPVPEGWTPEDANEDAEEDPKPKLC